MITKRALFVCSAGYSAFRFTVLFCSSGTRVSANEISRYHGKRSWSHPSVLFLFTRCRRSSLCTVPT